MSDMRRGSQGPITRALLWLVVGLLGAVVALVAVSPELVGNEPGLLFDLVGLVSVAAVPGLILIVFGAVRRKRLGLDDPDRDAQDGAALERSLRRLDDPGRRTDRTDGRD